MSSEIQASLMPRWQFRIWVVGRSPVVGTYESLHLRNKREVRRCHRLSLLFVFTFGVLSDSLPEL